MTDTITTPDIQERLRIAEAERGDYAIELIAIRDALAAEYLEAKRTADDTRDDKDQYLHMMFLGEQFAATRGYIRFLLATHQATSIDDASQRIDEGTAWGLVEAFIDAWVDLEGYDKYKLSPHRAAIADMVRDHLKHDSDFDQVPMADLVAPYLPGAAA